MRLTGYSTHAWTRLGRTVLAARRANGYADIHAWSEAIGRSTRTLRGLERGEPVAGETLVRIAEALGWPTDHVFELLEAAPSSVAVPRTDAATTVADLLAQIGVSAPRTGDLTVAEVRDIGQLIESLDGARSARPNQTTLGNEVIEAWINRLGHLIEADTRSRSNAKADIDAL